MTNRIESEGTDYKYEVLVTTANSEIISHPEATTWDVDEAGRLFLYNETATRYNSVATYNANAWAAVTRVTEEVYREVVCTDERVKAGERADKELWLDKREANRRKLQGD